MIVGKTSIGSVEELNGKTFAIAQVGSQDHQLSSKVLAAKGVPEDSINYVAIGAPNVRAQALSVYGPLLAFSATRRPNSLKVMTSTRSKMPFALRSLQKAATAFANSSSNR